jgi:hypothetical protein
VLAEGFSLPPDARREPVLTGSAAASDGVDRGRSGMAAPPAVLPGSLLDGVPNKSARCVRVRVVSTDTGEVVGLPCRSWRCPVCSVSNRRAFGKRFRMGLAMPGREISKFVTFTSVPGEAPYRSREMLSRRFAEVRRRLTRAFPGAVIEYVGTVELTQLGAVHFHVVMRGVPFMPAGPKSPWDRLSRACGFGMVDVRAANAGAGRYLSKSLGGYLIKSAASTAWPPHFHRVRFSRAWAPEWVSRGRRPRHEGAERWVLLEVVLPARAAGPHAGDVVRAPPPP